MTRYIKKEDIKYEIMPLSAMPDLFVRAKDIEAMPDEDVAPVIHARWVGIEYDGYADGYPVYDVFECSNCGMEHDGEEDTLTPYCPECGAKMDKEE